MIGVNFFTTPLQYFITTTEPSSICAGSKWGSEWYIGKIAGL
jgi:hypothetical protein